MNITIKVEAEELVKAINDLAHAVNNVSASINAMAEFSAIKQQPEPEPAETEQPKPEPDKAEQPKQQEKKEEIPLETVRAKLAVLSRSGKKDEVKALLQKFGASKLTDVPKEKYPELMAAAEELE